MRGQKPAVAAVLLGVDEKHKWVGLTVDIVGVVELVMLQILLVVVGQRGRVRRQQTGHVLRMHGQ